MYGLHLSEVFTYLNTSVISWEQGGLDNRGSTVDKIFMKFKNKICFTMNESVDSKYYDEIMILKARGLYKSLFQYFQEDRTYMSVDLYCIW